MNNVNQILENISDRRTKRLVEGILTGKIVKNVRCMSKRCKGRIVANIDSKGKIQPTVNKVGVMWLFASRQRLDGYLGFQCMCGNDSRLCKAEKGVKGIENNAVQKSDIEKVWNRLQKKKVVYPIRKKQQDIDNFIIETI